MRTNTLTLDVSLCDSWTNNPHVVVSILLQCPSRSIFLIDIPYDVHCNYRTALAGVVEGLAVLVKDMVSQDV